VKPHLRVLLAAAAVLVLAAAAAPQLRQVLRVVGVGAAVQQFGPDINRAINGLTNHRDTPTKTTKVVPILRIGIGAQSAIGAAQITGPKSAVDQVRAVAQPFTKLFNEVEVRALIPVATDRPNLEDLRPVEGVGVTGIVDLRL